MSNKLNFITPEENRNGIFILSNGSESKLAYYNNNDLVILGEGSSMFRPIHCSELHKVLKERGWNLIGTKYVSRLNSNPNLDNFSIYSTETKAKAEIPPINTSARDSGYSSMYSVKNEIENQIHNEFNNIFGEDMNVINEIDFYSSSWNTLNFLDSSITIDLIKYNSDTYTNTISLSELIKNNSSNGTAGEVCVSVQYSKNNELWTKNVSFLAFKYKLGNTGKSELLIENTEININEDITVSYKDGIIRLVPINSDIDEYIISNCTVTYGNI